MNKAPFKQYDEFLYQKEILGVETGENWIVFNDLVGNFEVLEAIE